MLPWTLELTRNAGMRPVIPGVVRSPSRRVVVAALLALSLALRLAGVDFGLPMAEARPDEQTIAYQAMKFGRGDFNPHAFNYPSLFKYIVFALFGGDYAVGRALGRFAGQDDFLRAFFAAETEFRLLVRLWTVAMGTLGVWLLTTGPGRLWGAALLAVNFLHVRDSHFGVTDITMTTGVTAAVILADRHAREGGRRWLLGAALVAGLATSVKYNAALLAVPLVLSAWFGPRAAREAMVALAVMLAGFLVGTPYALLDFRQFTTDFTYEVNHLAQGHHVDVGIGYAHHALRTLPHGMGVVGLVTALVGMGLAFRKRGRRALVLYSFPILYFLAIGKGETAFYRYMLPVVPFLCMAAGSALRALANRSTRGGAAVNLVLVAAMPAYSSLHADRLFLAGDTRAAMGAWIEANVPAQSTIVHAGAYTGAPMLQRNVANNTREYEARRGRADSAGFRKPDDMKYYQGDRPAYDVLFVEKQGIDFASQVSPAAVVADPPEYLEVESSGLTFYSAVPAEIAELVAARYTLVHEEVGSRGTGTGRFDQQDAFYMPVSGFRHYDRMGPDLRLFRRAR